MNRWLLSTAAVIWTQKTGIFLSRHLWWSKFLHVLNSLFRPPWAAGWPGVLHKEALYACDPQTPGKRPPCTFNMIHTQHHDCRQESPTEAFHLRCFAVTVAFKKKKKKNVGSVTRVNVLCYLKPAQQTPSCCI